MMSITSCCDGYSVQAGFNALSMFCLLGSVHGQSVQYVLDGLFLAELCKLEQKGNGTYEWIVETEHDNERGMSMQPKYTLPCTFACCEMLQLGIE